MKRYMSFYGYQYYPIGGMEDFISDFESIENAKEAIQVEIIKKYGADVHNWVWAHVYDTRKREIVWSRNEGRNDI